MSNSYWDADRLDRAIQSEILIRFLEGRLAQRAAQKSTRSYVLNIDSSWGQGKTFFLRGLIGDLRAKGHIVAYVNAWETDFADRPLLAVLTALEDALKPYFAKRAKLEKAWTTLVESGGSLASSLAKNVGTKLAQRYSGDFINEVADALDLPTGAEAGDDPTGAKATIADVIEKLSDKALETLLAQFRKEATSIDRFKKHMAAVVQAFPDGISEKFLFVLVDELDRCRPSYAIRLLEDAKHLFSVEGVVFVIATDTDQLTQSIKGIYGASFDSSRYLRRFFDRTYRFPEPDRSTFVSFLFQRDGIDQSKMAVANSVDPVQGSLKYFDSYECTLRDIEQCIDMLGTFLALWPHKVPVQLGYALPLIITYQRSDLESFNLLANPKGTEPASKPVMLWQEIHRSGDQTTRKNITTSELTLAFRSLLATKLWDVQSAGVGANEYARRVILHEFQAIHHGQFSYDTPVFSVLNEYRHYVALSDRFEPAEA